MDKAQVMVKLSQTETLTNRCLRILANNFESIDLKKIAELPRNLTSTLLKVISKRGYITDNNIQIFINEQTRILELNECLKLTNLGLEKICVCKNLIKLDLNSNNAPRLLIRADSLLKISSTCRQLKVVLLRRCVNIDDTCIEIIAKNCPQLTSLNVGNCPLITDKATESLGKYCNNLKSINLSGTKISDNGIFSLISDNISNTIEEIHIAHCNLITDESIECILIKCKLIKFLLFHCCPKTTDNSRIALENYMTNNSTQKIQHLTWSIY